MTTIRCDFREDPIAKAIELYLNTDTVLVFMDRDSLMRAQKIVQKEAPFGTLRLLTMDQLKRQCRKSLLPVLRRDLRPFVLYNVLTDDDKSALNISSFRTAKTFIAKFFRLMEEWQEYRLPLEIDWDALYENRLSGDTALWQQETWNRLLAIRQSHAEYLKRRQLTDTIFPAPIQKPHDLKDYARVVVVNPFHLTTNENDILNLFDECDIVRRTDLGWMKDESIGFDTLHEAITVDVRVIERTDEVSLNLSLAHCLEEGEALVVDNGDDPFYRLFDADLLSMDVRVSLDPAVQFLSILRDILINIEKRDDVQLFPAHILIRALECGMFSTRYCADNFHEDLLRRVKKEKIRSLPIDLNNMNGVKKEFHSDLRAILSMSGIHDLSDFITGLSLFIADHSSERVLRIMLDTVSTMRRIEIDLKGVQLLDAFLVTLESRTIHLPRGKGKSSLVRLDDTDSLEPGANVIFMNIQEGALPMQHHSDFLFTDRQRKVLGLPDSEHRRRHDLYRFIALCLSGGKVTLLYRTDKDANLHVSSFAEALMMHRGCRITESDDSFLFDGNYKSYIDGLYQLKRTDADPVETLRIPLQPLLKDESLPLSFSGLQTLTKDPVLYCIKHMMRLEPFSISEERGLDNQDFGNLVHEVMQNLFNEFNRLIQDDTISRSGIPIEEHRLGAMIDRQFDWVMRDKKKFFYKIPCGYSHEYFEQILLPYLRASVIDFVENFVRLVSPASIRQFRFYTECSKPVGSFYHNPPMELNYESGRLILALSGRIDLLAQEAAANRFWIFDFKTSTSDRFKDKLAQFQTRFYERILFSDEQGEPSGHGSCESRYYFVMDSQLNSYDAKTSWPELKTIIEKAFEPVVMSNYFLPSEKKTDRNEPYLPLYGLRGAK